MRAIELFAGIGGLRLGCEAVMPDVNVTTAVELNPIARYVYQHHFPDTPMHDDIKTFKPVEKVDLIYGGFPCTETSSAGKRTGLDGPNSGLWWEMHRTIRATNPRFVVIENPRGLLYRGGAEVIQSLADIGYDSEWQVISAESLGYPHKRERVFIVAYTHDVSERLDELQCCWSKYPREASKKVGFTEGRSEALSRCSKGDDGFQTWLGGGVSTRWFSKWRPPANPGRTKDCSTPLEKIERWVNNHAISMYGLSCIPEQAAIAFRYIKFLRTF
jgi:DNA (cytosine-5)-methyltransferase 1